MQRLVWLMVMGTVMWGCSAEVESTNAGAPVRETDADQRNSIQEERIMFRSPVFKDGDRIPEKYTADGENVSPPLEWSGLPEGTREVAIIVDDPDAPRDEPWVHWVIYQIPAAVQHLPEGMPKEATVDEPVKARQGENSWDEIGYGGPEPPRGHGTHHYHFKLYALDAPPNVEPGMTKEQLLQMMRGHVLAEAEFIGTYER